MFHDLKPYDESIDSGSSWLGSLPSHWRAAGARSVFGEVTSSGHIDEPLLSVTIGRGVLMQSDLLANSGKKDSSNLDRSKYKLVEPGDIAYNKMRAWQGAVGISRYRGIVSPAYVVMRPRRDSGTYLHHLLRTPRFAKEAERWSYGITSDQWSLRPEHFKMITFPVPPADEQAAIVKYLAHAHARIDRAIAAKRKLIALLDEQQQAVINQAVSRGLDHTGPLKDTGIPWLGLIPAHWSVKSIGAVSTLVQTGPFGSQLHADEYVSGGVPVINPSHISASSIHADPRVSVPEPTAVRLSRHRFEVGDVVIARRGELGRCAVAGAKEAGWLCGTGSLIVRPDREIDSRYLQIRVSSAATRAELGAHSTGATMPNLNAQMIARLRLPVPPIAEQQQIVDALAHEETAGRQRRRVIEEEILLLREFRTRLTSDVVTGQVDVRHIAATLPDLDPDELAADVGGTEDDLVDEAAEFLEDVDA